MKTPINAFAFEKLEKMNLKRQISCLHLNRMGNKNKTNMKIFNINLLNKNIHILNLIIFNLLYIQSNCEKTAIIINNNNKNMG